MSVNKVILIGNVGKDPEVRYLDNNSRVANFSLATTERGYTLANGTQVPDRTDWHNIVVWRGLAEVVEKYVKKGSPIYIEGKIRTRSYDDKTGSKRYVTEIFADNLQLLGRKDDTANEGGYTPNTTATTRPTTEPIMKAEPIIKAQPFDNNQFGASSTTEEEDLPF